MITLLQSTSPQRVVLTLTEKSTLTNPTYRLVCENVTTKEVITIELGTDLSLYKERYNEFEITTSLAIGQWQYSAIENVSDVVVEMGKLLVNKSQEFEFEAYKPNTNFITYGG